MGISGWNKHFFKNEKLGLAGNTEDTIQPTRSCLLLVRVYWPFMLGRSEKGEKECWEVIIEDKI